MPGVHRYLWAIPVAAALAMSGAARAEQAEHDGPTLAGRYTVDILTTAAGGLKRDTRLLGLLEVDAVVTASAFRTDDLAFHLTVQAVHGGGFSDQAVGDFQVVSNIDAVSGVRPLEAYAALKFGADRRGTIKAGLIDLNADFDVQETGALFINSSFGVGPDLSQTGANGPSIFPTTASAVTLEWAGERLTGRIGLFDGVAGDPDRQRRTVLHLPGETGLLAIGELDFALSDAAKLQVGAWSYTRRFERIDPADGPRRAGGNRGAYGLVEGTLARRGDRTLDAWLRIGVADATINPIALQIGGGIAYGRERSRTGLAVSHARLGRPARRAGIAAGDAPTPAETAIELTHSQALSDRVRVQPNLQIVRNPGWRGAIGDAVVAGVRLELTLF